MSDAAIAWLRTADGEQWSRERHAISSGRPEFVPPPQTLWRATGPLPRRHDPCGRPPEASASSKSGERA